MNLLYLKAAFAAMHLTTVSAAPEPLHVRDFGPNIEKYSVKNLPEINFPIPPSWAGSLPIGGAYGTDSLFFWLWQAETKAPSNDLIIWFNGGPGCSSLVGLFKENGPIQFYGNSTCPELNEYSYTKLANVLYIDQPAQIGLSTGDTSIYDIMNTVDSFALFFTKLLKTFPALAKMKMHFMGESYAGVYVPYIVQALLAQNSKLNVMSVSLGDATFGNGAAIEYVTTTKYVAQNQNHYLTSMIPSDILAALEQGDRECGFPGVLSQITYPPKGKIYIPGNPENSNSRRNIPQGAPTSSPFDADTCDFINGTRTPADILYLVRGGSGPDCYGPCATQDALLNWVSDHVRTGCATPYNIDVGCANTYTEDRFWTAYVNLASVQKALHVPGQVDFAKCSEVAQFAFNQTVVPPAYGILPDFIARGIAVHIYNGALDLVLPHLGAELAIQNMSWAGKQGFQTKPSAVFLDGNGKRAGVYHQERGLSYHLFDNAGHEVPQDDPAGAFAFVGQFVL